MAYCGPRGIPYEQWIGAADGWTEYSRQAAVAWLVREADRCGDCGQVRSDWLDERGVELRVPPFEVIDEFCAACDSLNLHRSDGPKEPDPAMHQAFRPVP